MKRSALAATTLAVLALTACTGQSGAATPSPTPVVTPTALPTSTATPSLTPQPVESGTTTTPSAAPSATPPKRTAAPHTPRPTPTADNEIPGALGTLPEGFSLPEEDRPGDDEVSAFTTAVWRASCPDRVLTLASASGITATRVKESVGPEHVVGNGLLVFTDAAAAQAFMAELGTQLASCATEGPDTDSWRTVQATDPLADLGEEGLQVRQWSEWDTGEGWVVAPGGSLQYLAREGRYVALTYEGGEYLGDTADLPDVVIDAETRITVMLDQLG